MTIARSPGCGPGLGFLLLHRYLFLLLLRCKIKQYRLRLHLIPSVHRVGSCFLLKEARPSNRAHRFAAVTGAGAARRPCAGAGQRLRRGWERRCGPSRELRTGCSPAWGAAERRSPSAVGGGFFAS